MIKNDAAFSLEFKYLPIVLLLEKIGETSSLTEL